MLGMRSLCLSLLLLSLPSLVKGSGPSCDDEMVAQLVAAHIANDLIFGQINKCDPHFNLDPSYLIALKKAGVSDDLVRAMARRQNGGTGTEQPAAPTVSGDDETNLPDEVGVYWKSPDGELFRIEGIAVSNVRTGSTLVSKATLRIKRERFNAQINGSRAALRIRSHQPQFYFVLPDGESIGDYVLLKLAQREDVRQIEVSERTFWKVQAGVDHAKEVEFSYTRVRSRLYLLIPKTEIPSGEFGFFLPSSSDPTRPSGRVYDFGID